MRIRRTPSRSDNEGSGTRGGEGRTGGGAVEDEGEGHEQGAEDERQQRHARAPPPLRRRRLHRLLRLRFPAPPLLIIARAGDLGGREEEEVWSVLADDGAARLRGRDLIGAAWGVAPRERVERVGDEELKC
jgi:hypothetical protein